MLYRIQISNGLGEIKDEDGNGLGEVLGDKDHNGSILVCAEETVQDSWRGWKNRKEHFSFQLEQAKVEREKAAIVIQVNKYILNVGDALVFQCPESG